MDHRNKAAKVDTALVVHRAVLAVPRQADHLKAVSADHLKAVLVVHLRARAASAVRLRADSAVDSAPVAAVAIHQVDQTHRPHWANSMQPMVATNTKILSHIVPTKTQTALDPIRLHLTSLDFVCRSALIKYSSFLLLEGKLNQTATVWTK